MLLCNFSLEFNGFFRNVHKNFHIFSFVPFQEQLSKERFIRKNDSYPVQFLWWKCCGSNNRIVPELSMNTGVRSSFQIIQMIDEIPQSMLKFGVILLSFQLKEKCKNSAYIGYLRNITLASIVLCVAVICVTDFCSIRLFIEKYRNF